MTLEAAPEALQCTSYADLLLRAPFLVLDDEWGAAPAACLSLKDKTQQASVRLL